MEANWSVAADRERCSGSGMCTVYAPGTFSQDAEARVVAAFDVSTERPLAADLDVAARWFGDGYDRRTHTPLFVRAAQLRGRASRRRTSR